MLRIWNKTDNIRLVCGREYTPEQVFEDMPWLEGAEVLILEGANGADQVMTLARAQALYGAETLDDINTAATRADAERRAELDAESDRARAESLLQYANVRAATAGLEDTKVLAFAPLCRVWAAGEIYTAGEPVVCGGKMYRVQQNVTAQAHQAPDSEGMLAVYRPIERVHTGTEADPIPWVSGMDCYAGMYYSYEDGVWLCTDDILPCVWHPGQVGAHWWVAA